MDKDEVACSHCEWVGAVPMIEDVCPNCKKRGTLAYLADVQWALPTPEVVGS